MADGLGMKVPIGLFLIFILILTNLLGFGYSQFTKYFESGSEVKYELVKLQNQVSKSNQERDIAQFRLIDLEQSIAEVLPTRKELIVSKWDSRVLNLSDGLRKPASMQFDRSEYYFTKGKKYFLDGEYTKSIQSFEKLMSLYPSSDRSVQSLFLTAESYYLLKDYRQTVSIVERMITQFPENDLTGFALLRLGQLSIMNSQFNEASSVIELVKSHYQDPQLLKEVAELESRIKFE